MNIVDYEGRNPLHMAGIFGQKEVADFLLRINLPVNALDNARNSALYYAIKHRNYDTARLLRSWGGEVATKRRRLSKLVMKYAWR